MRQSRKKLRARAVRANNSFSIPTTVRGSVKNGELRGMLLWLSGYEAARRDMAKATHGVKGPSGRRGLRVSDIVDVTVGPLSSAGAALDLNKCLLVGDRNIRSDVLTIPALSAEARAIRDGKHAGVSVGYRDPLQAYAPDGSLAGALTCPDCGTTIEARGSNGLGVYCPNGLCNS